MTKKRGILWAILAFCVLGAALAARRPVRKVDTENPLAATMAGLKCEWARDAGAVYHIRPAATSSVVDDAATFACMGYLHGMVRAWQMDYLRRIVQGRRSEIIGFGELRVDFAMRLLGLYDKARALFEQMSAEERTTLWAYTLGVNRAFEMQKDSPGYEFREMGYTPEPWHPIDSLGLLMLQSFSQTRKTFEQDLDEEHWRQVYGDAAESFFSPEGVPWDTSVLKKGEYPAGALPISRTRPAGDMSAVPMNEVLAPLQAWREFFPLGDGIEMGSNNWVVSSRQSKGQKAWFANDPHLDIRHPPFWQWIHVASAAGSGPDALEVFGASVPGVPSVASGTNRHVSWGLTNAYIDVADVYEVPETSLASATVTRPWLWVRVWKFWVPFFFKTYQSVVTGEGTALPVLPISAPKGKAWVLRWSGYDVTTQDMMRLRDIMRVKSVSEMDVAIGKVGLPAWNFVFADVEGKIGHRVMGRVPRRTSGPTFGTIKLEGKADGLVFPAWEYLTADEMPHVVAPSRGYIATANNRHWPADARFKDGRSQSKSYRAYQIETLLRRNPRHDFASLREVQCDIQATDGKFLAPLLVAAAAKSAFRQAIAETTIEASLAKHMLEAVQLLADWDYRTGPTCKACAIFRRWTSRLKEAAVLNDMALYRVLKTGVAPPRLPEVGTRAASFEQAFATTLKETVIELVGSGPGAAEWPTWQKLHLQGFEHLVSPTYFSDERRIFSPGDTHTIAMGDARWTNGRFEMDNGASQRLIIEMSDPPKVRGILGGSNDDVEVKEIDQPGTPWMKWATCQYDTVEFPFNWEQRADQLKVVSF
ncbi:MAG: penicillin acylase family protein [Bacteriovoracia bacterium]